jgi:hypothetical protein
MEKHTGSDMRRERAKNENTLMIYCLARDIIYPRGGSSDAYSFACMYKVE